MSGAGGRGWLAGGNILTDEEEGNGIGGLYSGNRGRYYMSTVKKNIQ